MQHFNFVWQIILVYNFLFCVNSAQNLFSKIKKGEGHPNSGCTMEEIINGNYKYPYEGHNVTTEDGYILEMQRIPFSPKNTTFQDKRPVLLILHGIASDSSVWVTISPEISFPLMMADNNYDVWMMNHRGTKFSRHIIYDRVKDFHKFYDYSLDDIIKYDIIPVVDYITEKTGQEKMFFVGYSQGAIVGLAFAASVPEYNQRFHQMAMFGPVWYGEHLVAPLYMFLSKYRDLAQAAMLFLGNRIDLVPDELRPAVYRILLSSPELQQAMFNAVSLFFGRDTSNFSWKWMPLLLQAFPGPTSLKNSEQVFNIITKAHFTYYDYGAEENLKVYGTEIVPDYNLTEIKAPISLYAGANDPLCRPQDLARLASEIPTIVETFIVPHRKFNHLEFAAGLKTKELLYTRVLQQFNKIRT